MSQAPASLENFSVAELIATSLEAFLGAAHLHLGGTLADGRKLDQGDPQEAWRALLAAGALIGRFEAFANPGVFAPVEAQMKDYMRQLAAKYPQVEFPLPARATEEAPVASLKDVARQAFGEPR